MLWTASFYLARVCKAAYEICDDADSTVEVARMTQMRAAVAIRRIFVTNTDNIAGRKDWPAVRWVGAWLTTDCNV